MGFTDRLKQVFGREKSVGSGNAMAAMNYPMNWFQRGYNTPTATNGGSVVEACVQAYAQTVAQLPGRQYELDESGTKSYIMGSKLARVLAKPNEFQTRSDFFLNMVYSIYTEGNAYWVGFGEGNQKPDKIYLLDPRVTEAHRVPETGDIFYSTSGVFADMVDISPIEGRAVIPSRYVGHVRLHTPHDPLRGVTPLQNAAASIAAHGAITGSQANFFANASRPSGFLSSDLDLSKTQMEALRGAWEDRSKDLNAGGVPILGNAMKWNPMIMSSQDAQLIEAWKMTVEDISRVLRVPPMLINSMENASFQNAETLMRFWLASGLGFLINHIELALSAFYGLDDRTQGVELDQEVLLRSDLQAQMEALGVGVTKGLLAPNEGRKKIGYGPVKGGDMPMVQQQMVGIDVANDPNRADLAPAAPAATPAPADDDDDEIKAAPISEDFLSSLVDNYMENSHAA